MKNLYESILRPDDLDNDTVQVAEIESIFKKYHWRPKSYSWEGKTLKIVFDGRGYMDDFDKVAAELHCKNFNIYPWALITSSTPLDGFKITAETRLDITCSEVKNCDLTADIQVEIIAPRANEKIKLIRNDIHSYSMRLQGIDGATMVGNDFSDVKRLTLAHVGPKIERIVLGWNFVTSTKGHWSTYPYPKGDPDPAMDPFKSLGLDKHFKNLEYLNIAAGTGGTDDYIFFTTNHGYKSTDWDIQKTMKLNNGYLAVVKNDARCIP